MFTGRSSGKMKSLEGVKRDGNVFWKGFWKVKGLEGVERYGILTGKGLGKARGMGRLKKEMECLYWKGFGKGEKVRKDEKKNEC